MAQRVIKFRAWDKLEKEMIEDFGRTNLWELCGGNETDYFAIMQFTDLLDKNGREIYEGDILTGNKVVRFGNIDGGYEGEYGIGFNVNPFHSEEMEIIGNIYENPELLKETT